MIQRHHDDLLGVPVSDRVTGTLTDQQIAAAADVSPTTARKVRRQLRDDQGVRLVRVRLADGSTCTVERPGNNSLGSSEMTRSAIRGESPAETLQIDPGHEIGKSGARIGHKSGNRWADRNALMESQDVPEWEPDNDDVNPPVTLVSRDALPELLGVSESTVSRRIADGTIQRAGIYLPPDRAGVELFSVVAVVAA